MKLVLQIINQNGLKKKNVFCLFLCVCVCVGGGGGGGLFSLEECVQILGSKCAVFGELSLNR